MFDFKSLTNQWRAVGRERETLAKEIERLRQRREFLDSAPLPLEDHLQKIDEWVDAQASLFDKTFRDLTRPKELKPFEPFSPHASLFMRRVDVQSIQQKDCGLYPEQTKAGYRARAEAKWNWYSADEIGPPPAEREQEKKTIDAELAKLERQLSNLDDQIQEAASEIPRERIKLSGKPVHPSRREAPQLVVDGPLFEVPADDGAGNVVETAADGAGNPSSGKES